MTVKLDKAIKDKLIEELSHPYGRVSLMCDGRKITLDVGQYKPLKYHIAVYVDGIFMGKWLFKGANHPESKYLYVVKKPVFSPTRKSAIIKAFGIRAAKKQFNLDEKIEGLMPCFPNGRMAINHLCKVCDSIEVINETNELAQAALNTMLKELALP